MRSENLIQARVHEYLLNLEKNKNLKSKFFFTIL